MWNRFRCLVLLIIYNCRLRRCLLLLYSRDAAYLPKCFNPHSVRDDLRMTTSIDIPSTDHRRRPSERLTILFFLQRIQRRIRTTIPIGWIPSDFGCSDCWARRAKFANAPPCLTVFKPDELNVGITSPGTGNATRLSSSSPRPDTSNIYMGFTDHRLRKPT